MKNKDLIARKIKDISPKEDLIIAKMESGEDSAYIVEPFLKEDLGSILEKLKPYETCALVTYNTKENIDIVLKAWDKLAKFKRNFSINFINPFSKTDKRWALYPMTHDFVTDRKDLKRSISIISSNVEYANKNEIEKVVNS